MSYMRYKKIHKTPGVTHYEYIDEYVRLLGCKNGYIPWLLEKNLINDPKKHESPYTWHINVLKGLNEMGGEYANTTIVIDLKEKQKKKNLSLYELLNVWGCSDESWSPMMLHISPLFIDADPKSVNRENFERKDEEIGDPAYTFLYANGGVKNGKLEEEWMPPGPNNSPVLWHDALQHFLLGIKCKTPEMFERF